MPLSAYTKRYGGGFIDNNVSFPADAQYLNAVETALLGLLGAAPTDAQAYVYDAALSRFKSALLTNAHIDPAAAIAKSKLAALNIADADIAAGAAISPTKLGSNIPISKLTGYPSASGSALLGDGTWGKLAGAIMGFGLGQAISTAASTFAGGAALLASNISITADGTSRYALVVLGPDWSHSFAGDTTMQAQAAVDGSAGGNILAYSRNTGVLVPLAGGIDLGVLSAAAHTVNVRMLSGAGATLTVPSGTLVFVVKVT